jgi:hypothetical protein
MNRSSNILAPVLAAVLSSIIWLPAVCIGQITGTPSGPQFAAGQSAAPSPSPSPAAQNDATADSSTNTGTPAPPSGATLGNGQTGANGLAGHVDQFTRYAPFRDHWITIDLDTRYVRAVLEGFEQGAGIGMGVQFTTADLLRVVEFRLTAITSPKLYRRFEGEAYIPKIFDNKTHADIWFDYLFRSEDEFFGIGPDTPKTSKTDYALEQRSFNASLYHDFARGVRAGAYARLANTSTYPGQNNRDIPSNEVFSGNPQAVPLTLFAPGLLQNTEILSYGGFGVMDRRDNSAGLTKGMYLYGRIGSSQGLKDGPAFSDYGWLGGEIDARGYVPLGSNKTSLALRGYADLEAPRGGSQIPFYDMPFLGGRSYLRGFENFRFRGDNLALFSAELRQTVWTQREDRGLDVFAFGDTGQVWGDNRSMIDPAIIANQGFASSNWKAAIGGGIQYRFSSNIAGRIEVGHSNERSIVYWSLTRGF